MLVQWSVAAAAVRVGAGTVVHTAIDRDRSVVRRTERAVRSAEAVVVGASRAGVDRVVVLGSAAEYGLAVAPQREDGPSLPTTGHGVAKAAGVAAAVAAGVREGVRVTVLRPFHVTGRGEPLDKLVPRALAAAHGGRPLPLVAGAPVRDLVDVDDVARGIRTAVSRPPDDHLPVNLCSGVATTVDQLRAAIERRLGRPVPTSGVHRRTALDGEHRVGDPGRAEDLLGWCAVGLDELVERSVAAWPWVAP